MIGAKLEGRKTMTRRESGLKELNKLSGDFRPDPGNKVVDYFFRSPRQTYIAKCPYGKVGDILYARETYYKTTVPNLAFDGVESVKYYNVYKADKECEYGIPIGITESEKHNELVICHCPQRWIPSIHMPKSAARIIDQIVSIRAEKLRSITSSDIIKEGVCTQDFLDKNGIDKVFTEWFRLWTSIHKEYNPDMWLWVIETKTLSTTGWKGVDQSIISQIENI